ncbi:MAG: HAD hydrolase-like protein [Candidatus Marinimicrobia bacterium]|nr:HAD hydrolase-like protein [Candidatus Neomarinimicrobiota bacterium]
MKIQNILFDLDGTLTDPSEGIVNCIIHTLKKLNQSVPEREKLAAWIGPPLRENFANFLDTEDPEVIENAVTIFRDRFSDVGLFENQVYDGIPELLETLRSSGKTLFIVTGKPEPYAKRILAHFQMAACFQSIYGAQLDGTFDDKTVLMGHVLRNEGIEPDKSIMIGDRKHDIMAASKHNISTIGVTYGFGTEHELKTAGADTVVHTPEQLLNILHSPG